MLLALLRWLTGGQTAEPDKGGEASPGGPPARAPGKTAVFFYGRGGGGHLASAIAVRDCLTQEHAWSADLLAAAGLPPTGAPFLSDEYRVLIVDIGKLAEESVLGPLARLSPFSGDDIYNWCIRNGQYALAEFATKMGLGVSAGAVAARGPAAAHPPLTRHAPPSRRFPARRRAGTAASLSWALPPTCARSSRAWWSRSCPRSTSCSGAPCTRCARPAHRAARRSPPPTRPARARGRRPSLPFSQASAGVPLLTVATDMESCGLHCWIDPHVPDSAGEGAAPHTIVAGGRRLQQQAEAAGYPHGRILRTDGMVVHPSFYRANRPEQAAWSAAQPPRTRSRSALRARRASSPRPDARVAGGGAVRTAVPTVVLFFGGFAPPRTEQIADGLFGRFGAQRLRLVVLCGRNESLKARLDGRVRAARAAAAWREGGAAAAAGEGVGWAGAEVVGFVDADELVRRMRGASAVMGKPGPGAASEAQVLRVPFVTELNSGTMQQERSVAKWLLETGYGVVVERLEDCPPDLFGKLDRCRVSLAGSAQNLAVFQVAARVLAHLRDPADRRAQADAGAPAAAREPGSARRAAGARRESMAARSTR